MLHAWPIECLQSALIRLQQSKDMHVPCLHACSKQMPSKFKLPVSVLWAASCTRITCEAALVRSRHCISNGACPQHGSGQQAVRADAFLIIATHACDMGTMFTMSLAQHPFLNTRAHLLILSLIVSLASFPFWATSCGTTRFARVYPESADPAVEHHDTISCNVAHGSCETLKNEQPNL